MPERYGYNPESSNAEPPEEDGGISRRDFLKKLGITAASVALTGNILNSEKVFSESDTPEGTVDSEISEVNAIGKYKTGALAGEKIGQNNLFNFYTGIADRVVPAIASVNYRKQLQLLGEKKEEFCRIKHKKNTAFKAAQAQLLKEYLSKSPERETFQQYQSDVHLAIREVHKYLDWDKVGELVDLDHEETILLKEIISALDQKHLTAYAWTELMPGTDGELNHKIYEYLLKTAGSRYVYSIPAIYDDRLSFGPYQFTSGALMDLGDGHPVGASKINQAMAEGHRIPANVASLRGISHHKAALLFATYNMARFIKKLNTKQKAVLKAHWRSNMTAITQFIATAHHLPEHAYKAGERWIDGKTKHPFEVSCPESIHEYAIKTKSNLKALTVK